MAEKNFSTRIVHKHDTEENWLKATTKFIPKQGELIVYDIDDNYDYERIKIGDGVKNVNDLQFVEDALKNSLLTEIGAMDDKVVAISNLVGDTSVSDQISEALINGQPDWNQNDDTAAGHIKNRPFYTKDPVEVELINDTLSFELLDGLYICEIGELSYDLKPGTEIIVNYDGTEYNSVVKEFMFGFYAFNSSLMNSLTGLDFENTGEPFMVHYYNGEIAVYTSDTAATHNITISVVDIEDVKIDKKYMPEPIHIVNKDVYTAVGLTSFNPVDITQTIEFPIVDLEAGDVVQLYINATGSDTVSGADYEAVGEIVINAQVEDYIVGSEVVGKELVFDPIVLINNLRFSSAASTLKSIILNYYGDAAMRLKGTLAESILTGFSSSFSGQIDIAYPKVVSAFDGLDVWSLTGGSVQRFTVSVDDSGIITTTNMEDGSQVKFAKHGSGLGKAGSNTNAEIFNDYVDSTATGQYSHAEGRKTTAGNYAAHAEGRDSKATGMYSHAEGYNSTASADCGHAEGSVSTASGNAAHAEGQGTIASGQCSHSEGYNTTAMGHSAHSEGRSSNDVPTTITTSTDNDTIISSWETKKFNLAKYDQCHTEGNDTLALDTCAHAEGYETIASGGYSHSEGYKTRATGTTAHAEGRNGKATGYGSHVEGDACEASANFTHSEGSHTVASQPQAHAEGMYTIAASDNQHVQGKYNIEDASDIYAHIVGNGTSSARSNAHTLDWDGNAWFSGDVYVGGTDKATGEKLVKQSELPEAVTVDATLSNSGQAADAKATGDAISALNTLVGDVAVSEQIDTAIDEIHIVDNYNNGLMTSTDKKKLDAIESGAQKNVQSSWTQNDMTSMEFVQNRPFYDGPLSITWDGVTKGHPAHMYDSSNYLIKITDTVFTDEELQTAKFVINENGTTTEVVVADVWEDRSTTSSLTGIWYNSMPCVYVVRQTGSLVGPGTYFLYNYSSKIYIQSLTVGSDDNVKQIDEKYIPDSIARTSDLNSISELVGDTAVAEQITTAIADKADKPETVMQSGSGGSSTYPIAITCESVYVNMSQISTYWDVSGAPAHIKVLFRTFGGNIYMKNGTEDVTLTIYKADGTVTTSNNVLCSASFGNPKDFILDVYKTSATAATVVVSNDASTGLYSSMPDVIAIENGGTGANNAADALTNLGAAKAPSSTLVNPGTGTESAPVVVTEENLYCTVASGNGYWDISSAPSHMKILWRTFGGALYLQNGTSNMTLTIYQSNGSTSTGNYISCSSSKGMPNFENFILDVFKNSDSTATVFVSNEAGSGVGFSKNNTISYSAVSGTSSSSPYVLPSGVSTFVVDTDDTYDCQVYFKAPNYGSATLYFVNNGLDNFSLNIVPQGQSVYGGSISNGYISSIVGANEAQHNYGGGGNSWGKIDIINNFDCTWVYINDFTS